MSEQWKPVVGYEGTYEVSSLGIIRRVSNSNAARSGRILTGFVSDGYRRVLLSLRGAHRKHFVHDLVCCAFYGPRPSPRHEAAHTNGIRLDARLENLSWKTREANKADMILHGSRIQGEKCHLSKLSETDVQSIFSLSRSGLKQTELARLFKVSQTNISTILQRQTWKHVEVLPNA